MTFRSVAEQPLRLVRGRWFFFADGPNARGRSETGSPCMIRAVRKGTAPDPVASLRPKRNPGHRPMRSPAACIVARGRNWPLAPAASIRFSNRAFIEAGVPDARTRYNRNNVNCQRCLLMLAPGRWQGRPLRNCPEKWRLGLWLKYMLLRISTVSGRHNLPIELCLLPSELLQCLHRCWVISVRRR